MLGNPRLTIPVRLGHVRHAGTELVDSGVIRLAAWLGNRCEDARPASVLDPHELAEPLHRNTPGTARFIAIVSEAPCPELDAPSRTVLVVEHRRSHDELHLDVGRPRERLPIRDETEHDRLDGFL